jgi:hypothetical protein
MLWRAYQIARRSSFDQLSGAQHGDFVAMIRKVCRIAGSDDAAHVAWPVARPRRCGVVVHLDGWRRYTGRTGALKLCRKVAIAE